jgi:tetratricopeptide (TPR) repeat protein
VSRRGVESPQKAVEFFQQVIAIDPGFAPAYAGLADAYAYMSIPTYQGMPWDKAQALMRPAALKALALDPDLAEAHAAMGVVHSRDRKWADAQHEFEQALALNPSLSQVYTAYSIFTLRPLRKFDKAEQLVRLALHNDPLSLDVWRELGDLQFTAGRYDEAIGLLERVRAVDPELPFADLSLGRALVFRGRTDEALAIYDAMAAQQHPVPHYRAYAYVRAGRRADAQRLAAENQQYAFRATIIYAALGDLDRAFEALNRTAESEPQRVPLLLTWPEMAPLRADPRFAAIRTRFGLP